MRPLPARTEFDEDAYLQFHPDVAAAIHAGTVGSAWQHYLLHGRAEGRRWQSRPDPLLGVNRTLSPQDEMAAGNPDHYFDVGASALQSILAALAVARRDQASITTILDLPCGHGRVLRFLQAAFPAALITACDLNRDGVDFCAAEFGASPVYSRPNPADLTMPDAYDLIWCGSLLTHLAEPVCREFLRQFHRWLRPGGILIFTLHGRHFEHDLTSTDSLSRLTSAQTQALLSAYRADGFGYVDYADQAGYGFSLTHPSHVMSHWLPLGDWKVLTYHENGWDKRQDVVSLIKSHR
jgi:SAM-dependent methyltransferase